MGREWIVRWVLCVVILSGTVFAEESDTAIFNGTVVGSGGTPIEDAKLDLYLLTIDQGSFSYKVRSVGKTTSDAEGKFAFSADPGHVKGYTIYCCLAQKEGFSCGWACAMAVNEATWTITLGEPKEIIGFVQNPDGTAVPEAEVRLVMLGIKGREDGLMLGIEPVEAFVTKTCSDGRFEFNNLPENASVEFLVTKSGKGTFHTMKTSASPSNGLTYNAGQTDIKLILPAACMISGNVMTQEGQKPVEGVSVIVQDTKIPVNLFRKPVNSGVDGSFEFIDLAPGDYKVIAISDDWIAEPVTVSVTADSEVKADIKLTKGGMLEVRVIESETKEAVSGASVNVRDEETQQYQHFQTDEKGLGSKQVLPGSYKVSVYKQGYRSSNEADSAVVENGETATVTVELGGQPKIKGQVTDAESNPLKGAQVRLFPDHGPRGEGIVSNEKGEFTLSWDPGRMGWTEGEFYLLATHPEKKLAGVIQIAEDTKEATINLEKGISAKGKVVNQDGEPIAGARTSLHFHGSHFSTSSGMETKTNPNGEYTFSPLALEQRYSVHISNADGYGNGRQEVKPDTGSKEVAVDDIVLYVADQKITGQVVDIDGKGLADVRLHCYGEKQPNIQAKTDKDGKFVLEPVCAAEINISANYRNGQEYQYGHVRTEGGAENVKVIVTSQGGGQRFVPKKAVSLVGRSLPDLTACGVEVPEVGNGVLVFVWDMSQRPSRYFMKQLSTKADLLKEKEVMVLLVNAASVEKEKLDAWLQKNSITWPCGVIAENIEDVKHKIGVQGLPWLILTDDEHMVISEGFSVEELESKLSEAH